MPSSSLLLDHTPLSLSLPQAERLSLNGAYFDALLSLIPPDAYFGARDADKAASAAARFMRNKKDAAPDRERKLATKAAARLARFDPALAATTLVPGLVAARGAESDRHLQESAAEQARSSKKRGRADEDDDDDDDDNEEEEGGDEEEGEDSDADMGDGMSSGPVSAENAALANAPLEELRARLAAKLASLKASRTSQKDPAHNARAVAADAKKLVEKAQKRAKKKAARAAAKGKVASGGVVPVTKVVTKSGDVNTGVKSSKGSKSEAKSGSVAANGANSTTKSAKTSSSSAAATTTSTAAALKGDKKQKLASAVAATTTKPPTAAPLRDSGSSGSATGGKVSHTSTTTNVGGGSNASSTSAAAAAAARASLLGTSSKLDLAFGALSSALPSHLATVVESKSALTSTAPVARGGKAGALTAMLTQAKAYQAQLGALEASGDAAARTALVFDAALSRASGAAVRDDPRLIQKALKREKASKHRSASAWASREATVKAESRERIEKKAENRAAKTQRALKKKDRKGGGGKATKKGGAPQNRPGFEGRVAGGGGGA